MNQALIQLNLRKPAAIGCRPINFFRGNFGTLSAPIRSLLSRRRLLLKKNRSRYKLLRMSRTLPHQQRTMPGRFRDRIRGERRGKRRYELALALEYKLVEGHRVMAGSSVTRNLSSSGIAFEVPLPVKNGSHAELSVCWPVALNGSVPLQLAITGRVIRSDGRLVAVRVLTSQFRILRRGKLPAHIGISARRHLPDPPAPPPELPRSSPAL